MDTLMAQIELANILKMEITTQKKEDGMDGQILKRALKKTKERRVGNYSHLKLWML